MYFEFDYELRPDLAEKGSREGSARITDDGLELINVSGRTRITWPMIDRVEPGPEVWIFYVNSKPLPLPSWALAGDPGRFILEKIGQTP